MNTRCDCGARDWEFVDRERGARCRACGGSLHRVDSASHPVDCPCERCADLGCRPSDVPPSPEIAGALEELRDLTGDPTARVVRVYPVWFLSARSTRLADARGTGRVHCHVRTKDGLEYLRASVNDDGQLELDEHGPVETTLPYARVASALAGTSVRLLLVPARQVTAFWDPTTDLLLAVRSASSTLSLDRAVDGQTFEEVLAQIELHWLFKRMLVVVP